MDPSELPAMFQNIENRVGAAASPAVLAMAHTFERAVKRNLALTSHPPHIRTPSPEGSFPSLMTGRLRRSVTSEGGGGDPVAEASVAPHVFYAGIQEYGRPQGMTARPGGYMHFWTDGVEYFRKHVRAPARPYMHPTIRQCIGNGSLGRAAADAFEISVWGH